MKKKMESRELGLVLTELLLGAQDLHYGYWDDDLTLSVGNAVVAQQRYTDMLLNALPPIADPANEVRVLDIGCGTGHTITQMLDRGYRADGVSPAEALSLRVKQRLTAYPEAQSLLYECPFQDFPETHCHNQYDAALFSESFQYIRMNHSFGKLEKLLKPGGLVIICDFFKTAAEGDGGPGDGRIRGGHAMADFYKILPEFPYEIEQDDDITPYMSPNLELLNDLLMKRIRPAGIAVGQYVTSNYPVGARLLKLGMRPFRKQWNKIVFKYFSGQRSKAVFERYKTYRLIRLRYQPR